LKNAAVAIEIADAAHAKETMRRPHERRWKGQRWKIWDAVLRDSFSRVHEQVRQVKKSDLISSYEIVIR
jgi:hypothetical protein